MSACVFEAVVGNPQHPEYGAATLPFPIPSGQYDEIIHLLLRPMGIGDAVNQDCVVKEMSPGCWPVLRCLEGQSVNVDELDYLAKRLDSFGAGEDAQFQGMAHKLGLTDIKDLINLTFCCQQATVITDFSDWSKIARDHFINTHGGSASAEDLAKLNGTQLVADLIRSEKGTLTPYGVVYDNGMELEQLYRGTVFPAYLYDRPQVVLRVTPRDAPDDLAHTTFLYLPSPQSQIDRALQRGGIQDIENAVIRFDSNDLSEEISGALEGIKYTVRELNEMCRAISTLDEWEQEKPLVGRITYINGEVEEFREPEEFLATVKENLDVLSPFGLKIETLTDAPEVRKAVDDILWGLFGDENPQPLADYEKKPEMTMGGM